MTSQPASIDFTQFDSESEDYDALPAGSTAILAATTIFAIPVMAVSLALIPVAAAIRSIEGAIRGSVRPAEAV